MTIADDVAELATRGVAEAEPSALAAVLAQLTGDLGWVRDPRLEDLRAGGDDDGYLDEAAGALHELAAADVPIRSEPDDATLLEIARAALGARVYPQDLPRLRHCLWPEDGWPAIDPAAAARSGLRVTVVGAGMGGIGIAAALVAAGLDVTVLERRAGPGGVWLDNRYPDCGVDTQAFQYAWELMPNTGWSRFDAKRDEILSYVEGAFAKSGVRDRTWFGVEVHEAVWSGDRWILHTTRDGCAERVETDVLVTAVGALNRPKLPKLPGLDRFRGPTLHTAEWEAGAELDGKRVALVGNGSSGTQVGRAIAERAAHLTAFQRSPHWIRPRGRAEIGEIGDGLRWLVATVPFYLGWNRFEMTFVSGDTEHGKMVRQTDGSAYTPTAENDRVRGALTAYIHEQVGGRADLIEKLTPSYPPYGKRMVIDNGWYDTLTRPHVDLVTDPIERVTGTGILTVDGRHHDVDVLVFATGFHSTRYFWPMEIVGRSGRSLAETHGGSDNIRSYLGVAMPGYPNLFTVQGPNSGLGHTGSVTMISECQSRYILGCLQLMIDRGARTIEVRPEVSQSYNAEMDRALDRMVWSVDDLHSRYRNDEGRIVVNHPWTMGRFWDLTRTVRAAEFDLT